jgi:hypothetical protein
MSRDELSRWAPRSGYIRKVLIVYWPGPLK